jgi:hypothetical protein
VDVTVNARMRYALICDTQLANWDNRGNEIDYVAAATCQGGGCGAQNALVCADQSCTQPGDVSKCGSSCSSCSAPSNGYPTCPSGSCGYSCFDSQQAICGGCYPSDYSEKCGGCYQNSDPNHCGSSCLVCDPPTGNSTLDCDYPGHAGCCCYTCSSGKYCCECPGPVGFVCSGTTCP